MGLRHFLVVPAVVVALTGAALAPADALGRGQPELGTSGDTSAVADVELRSALEQADLVATWIDAGRVSAEAALVQVRGGSTYDAARDSLLVRLADLTARSRFLDGRSADYDEADAQVDRLEQVVLDLRRQAVTGTTNAATSLGASELYEARVALAGAVPDHRQGGFSLDSIDVINYRLVRIKGLLGRELEALGRLDAAEPKSHDALFARFRSFPADLDEVRTLIELGRQSEIERRLRLAADRADVVEAMDDLHALRTTASTAVAGLSLVTLDAYVRAAAANPSCGIDWTLLAGIGRVESRHGTIGDGRVLASGAVTQPILGPLLDGGATAAEARAAAVLAEEEAARLVEEEEAAAAQAAAEEAAAFNALVWGDETLTRADETAAEAAAASREPVGLAAEPVPEVLDPDPLFDPLLWGDDLPFGGDDDGDDGDDEEDRDGDDGEEEDDDESEGNGFAVIVDTDNGRLDGNARWDRAVGPMQFIPETWSNYAVDGNGDGVADPQNLYDAAATAARFLCHLKQTRGASPHVFVLGYNSSQTYVRNVMAVADAFKAVDLPVAGD